MFDGPAGKAYNAFTIRVYTIPFVSAVHDHPCG